MTAKHPPTGLQASELLSLSVLERLAVAREARLIFGVQAARRVWVAAQLPHVDRAATERLPSENMSQVERFLEGYTVADPASEVPSKILIDAYVNWCQSTGLPAPSRPSVGRFFVRCGLRRRKRSGTIYTGLRLIGASSSQHPNQPSLLEEFEV